MHAATCPSVIKPASPARFLQAQHAHLACCSDQRCQAVIIQVLHVAQLQGLQGPQPPPPTHSKTARRVSSSAPHHASSQAQQRHSLKQGPSHRYTTLASAGTCPPHKPAEQHKQEQKQPQLQLDPLTASLGRRWITPTSRWAEMAGPSHRVRSARCASPLRAARPASDVCSQLSARWRRLQCPLNALCADSRDTQIME